MVGMLIQFGIFALLIGLGLFVGGTTERKHFASLKRRETNISTAVVTTQTRNFLQPAASDKPPCIVVSEVVIASDYLKSFLAKLKNIFGGNVPSFESLLERGRREALLRLQEKAATAGYNAICNVRIETADIGGNLGKKGVAMAAVIGTATAYHTSLPSLSATATHGGGSPA